MEWNKQEEGEKITFAFSASGGVVEYGDRKLKARRVRYKTRFSSLRLG